MPRPTISLCMIVKNEARILGRCLDSVQGAVDEMVVVDTGSTDGTPDIARRYGARIVNEPWRDHFARARNAGLAHARGDWILFLDADEQLDPEDRPKVWEAVRDAGCEAVLVQVHNYAGPRREEAVINPVVRLFRNRPEYRFEGRIHEQITPSICRRRPDAPFLLTDIRIHHDGYRPEVVQSKGKIARNVRLLHMELEERPEEPFLWYNLGVEYLRLGKIEAALEAFRQARMRVDPETAFWAHLIFKYEARCLHALDRPAEAASVCEEGLKHYPAYTDLYFWRGAYLLEDGRWGAAAESLRRAVSLGPAPSSFHREEGTGTYRPCLLLGAVAERLRVYDAALAWYQAALTHRPDATEVRFRMETLRRCFLDGERAKQSFSRSGDRDAAVPRPSPFGRFSGRLNDMLQTADRHLAALQRSGNRHPFGNPATAARLALLRLRPQKEDGEHVL